MMRQLLQESMFIRFFKKLKRLSQNSYLFHFDFRININTVDTSEQKPQVYSLGSSLLIVLRDSLSTTARITHQLLDNSWIMRSKMNYIQSLQSHSLKSTLLFLWGVILTMSFKAGSLTWVAIIASLGLVSIWFHSLFKRFYKGSVLINWIRTIVKGGNSL